MWYTSRAGLILMDVFIPIGASASIQDVRYRHVEGWAELPDGVEAWGQTIGIETDDNDNLWVFHRCFANNCREREDVPPMLRYDPSGRLVDSWGEGMFVWPGIMASGIHIAEDDTVLVADYQLRKGIIIAKASDFSEIAVIDEALPEGVAMDGMGNVFAAEVTGRDLMKLSPVR